MIGNGMVEQCAVKIKGDRVDDRNGSRAENGTNDHQCERVRHARREDICARLEQIIASDHQKNHDPDGLLPLETGQFR